jgi:SAM-dependent methyltransferase
LSFLFKKYADYYDLIYSHKDYKKEVNYLNAILMKLKVKTKANILELGCGTGKHAVELSKLNYSVHGIDISKDMVRLAKKQKTLKLNFEIGDVRKFRSLMLFDAVISLFHVISYQLNYYDLLDTFKTANINLKKNSFFIFDCWYGPAVLSHPPKIKYKHIKQKDFKLTRVAYPNLLQRESVVDVEYKIRITDKISKKNIDFNEVHRVRYYFKSEIEYFLEQAGFKLMENFEWMTSKQLSEKTWGSCYVAKKIREI